MKYVIPESEYFYLHVISVFPEVEEIHVKWVDSEGF